jgi:hypothetical protein
MLYAERKRAAKGMLCPLIVTFIAVPHKPDKPESNRTQN